MPIFPYFWPEILCKFASSKIKPYFYKNSIKPLQRNLFYIVFLTIFLTLGNAKTYSQKLPEQKKTFTAKNQETKPENLEKIELKPSDITVVDTSKKKKPLLESKVKYKAEKYAKIDQKKKLEARIKHNRPTKGSVAILNASATKGSFSSGLIDTCSSVSGSVPKISSLSSGDGNNSIT